MSSCPFHISRKFIDLPFGRNRCVSPWRGPQAPARWFYALLLCGCSAPTHNKEPPATPPPAPVAAPAPAVPIAINPAHAKAPADKKTRHKVRKTKPPEDAMALEPNTLIGKEPSAVEKMLGSPAGIAQKDVSLVWTYGGPDCVFQVYFYPDIKTSIFHALQFTAATPDGRKVEVSHDCIQRLLLARK